VPLGDFDVVGGCLELHTFCTGSSDGIGNKRAHWICENLARRLDEWSEGTSRGFDKAVKVMCKEVVAEYGWWRYKYIEQFEKKPEEQECWQDGLFDEYLKERAER